jgi:mono/diheme cytochrome c family protein
MPGYFPHSRLARVIGACLLASFLLIVVSSAAWAQEGDITRGSQIFDANCAVCHGPDGQGRVGADLSNAWPAIDPAAFTRAVIEQGVAGTAMTPWSLQYGGPLNDQEIEDVVAFVTSLSGGRSPMAPTATPFPVTPVPTVPGSTGDPTAGKALFVANCAMCHGDDGQGRSGASLDQGFASINPQQFVRATVAEGIENSAMPAWSQTNGGPLTESEIDNISAFIITLPGQSQQQPAATATPAPAPASDGGGTNWLMIILALVVVVVVIVAIIALSGRNKTA